MDKDIISTYSFNLKGSKPLADKVLSYWKSITK